MQKKSYTHMGAEERETLSLGQSQGFSMRAMARVLGRAPSTVSREHARATRGLGRPSLDARSKGQPDYPASRSFVLREAGFLDAASVFVAVGNRPWVAPIHGV